MVHLFLATLAAAAPTVEHAIIVKDWAVGCDNVLSCEAKSLDPGDQEPDIQISVDQGAGGDAPPSVEIVLKKSGLKLAIDGEPLPVDFDVEDGSYAYPVDPVGFLRLAVSGNQLQQQDESGQSIASASLDGLSAALRYIDDRQKRAGTRAALVAKGPLPSSRVPAALEYPKIKKPIRNQSDPAAPPRKLLPPNISESAVPNGTASSVPLKCSASMIDTRSSCSACLLLPAVSVHTMRRPSSS